LVYSSGLCRALFVHLKNAKMILLHCAFIQAAEFSKQVNLSNLFSFHKLIYYIATGQDKQDNSAICNEIKQKIAKRKGNTSIVSLYIYIEAVPLELEPCEPNIILQSYRSRTAASNEYQVAHKMATEKLHELEQTREE
jgi:hypothetical protein